MRTRIFTLLVAFLAIAGNAVWGQETQPSGQGTENDPYLLGTEADLKWFQEHVSESEDNAKACAKLTADITLNSSEEWEPIGYTKTTESGGTTHTYYYTGTFDGDNNSISGLSAPLFKVVGTISDDLFAQPIKGGKIVGTRDDTQGSFEIDINKLYDAYNTCETINTSTLKPYVDRVQSPAYAILMEMGLA